MTHQKTPKLNVEWSFQWNLFHCPATTFLYSSVNVSFPWRVYVITFYITEWSERVMWISTAPALFRKKNHHRHANTHFHTHATRQLFSFASDKSGKEMLIDKLWKLSLFRLVLFKCFENFPLNRKGRKMWRYVKCIAVFLFVERLIRHKFISRARKRSPRSQSFSR